MRRIFMLHAWVVLLTVACVTGDEAGLPVVDGGGRWTGTGSNPGGSHLGPPFRDEASLTPPSTEPGGVDREQEGEGPVRFVVLGDGGTGGQAQFGVARTVADVCARRGCDFALYLGDNIYNDGVESVADEQFIDKFEVPYQELDFPFYVVLGNHDYGGSGLGLDLAGDRADLQVAYSERSDRWVMPSHYYTVRIGPVAFFALDTNAILHDKFRPMAEQLAWLRRELEVETAPWKIAFGHHPYISNGGHGNAGNYDGVGWLPLASRNGDRMQELAEEGLCGRVQIYLAGHDHHREWLEPTCGTSFLISGAAAKLRGLQGRDDQPTRFADDGREGFLWAEIAGDVFTGVFYDRDGQIDYEDQIFR